MKDNIFFLKCSQSHALKGTIEALKDILIDVSVTISTDGLKICCLDYSKTAIVFLKIDADKCDEFHCSSPITIGLCMGSLFKLIKSMMSNDIISLFIRSDSTEKLRICIESKDRCMRIESELTTLDLDDDSITIPKIDFSCILQVPSSEFSKNVRDLANVGEYVQLSVVDGTFRMTATGNFATQTLIFSERLNGLQFQSCSDENIQGKFSLKYLSLFSKSASLSSMVEIYMRSQIPLVLKYNIGTIGRMQYVLSPKTDED